MTANPLTVHCSFLPIVANCSAAAHSSGSRIRIADAEDAADLGIAVHVVSKEIVAVGDRPENLAEYASEYSCSENELGVLTWYALQFWKEHGNLFSFPRTEVELGYDVIGQPVRIVGTTDVMSIESAIFGILLDWKSGRMGEETVKEQVMGYATCLAAEHMLSEVSAIVAWLRDQTYQRWTWRAEELFDWVAELARKVIQEPDHFNLGTWCRFCPRFLECPAQRDLLMTTATAIQATGVSALSPQTLAGLYPRVQSLERIIKAYRGQVRAAVEQLGSIETDDGYVLSLQSRILRELDPVKAWPVMETLLGGEPERMAKCVKISMPKLVAEVKASAARGQKKLVQLELEAALEAAKAITLKEQQALRWAAKEKEDEQD